ncbi:uncharacterized protein PHACADRAFT_179748 [Phanerochaete carnosa HHB-10118-sp]|uniref:Amidase domain-containing protein n=1 Tax=Phanerochaete carnosa (strain HHB-10118-sp) TaxID=650164 RepID=K5WM24_PHACS|nr:uncharacterized protein PHACADRAFT_179748 [Phanerochaete carnosa HHB-10118-sp]EKM60485.1 hypothetical protein PHACADRAFT_179748 [Phanerochaete carnosa HHB-10118-sp]
MSSNSKDWQKLCAERKERRLQSIPKDWLIHAPPESQRNVLNVPETCGLLTGHELDITSTTDVDTLLGKLALGQWSSVEVTTAFYKRAIVAQQLTNCLTEIFVEKALARAKEVDEYFQQTGKTIGPLHGLPISLKDQFCIKGMDTVMGYAGWIGKPAEKDSVLIEILYDLGAVPFVRTNVPQTLLWGETYNHVFGRTTNPYDRYMTPGGSTGGEGALLAMHGSPLGVGTDIGGSVRIPAAFCGLYSLRPSYGRLPYQGCVNSQLGQESISSVLGPMTSSPSGVLRFTKAIIDAKPWNSDPLAVRKPWSRDEYELGEHGNGVGMCFAIMWDDDIVKPHPPVIRAMEITKAALEAAGHKVINWVPHRHAEIYKNTAQIFFADSGHDFFTDCELSGEPLIQTMSPAENAHELVLDGLPLSRTLVEKPAHLSAYDLWQLHNEKRELRKSYLDHWEATKAITGTGRAVDAIISPVSPHTACPHGCHIHGFYTVLCNNLDLTTSVFPVSFADKDLDKKLPPHEFRNQDDKAVYHLYDSELFHGLPVGLQLIGRTLEEEGVIGMTEVMDKALKAYKAA